MTFKPAPNHPSIDWMWDRVREGTPALCALRMMREEGYALSSKLFRNVYHAMQRTLESRKRAQLRISLARRRERNALQNSHNRGVQAWQGHASQPNS